MWAARPAVRNTCNQVLGPTLTLACHTHPAESCTVGTWEDFKNKCPVSEAANRGHVIPADMP